jgi:hypothetical protein
LVFLEQQKGPVPQIVVTEMEIAWSGWTCVGYSPNATECTFDAARRKLAEIGYGDSLLKLISNTTSYDKWNLGTGLEADLSGVRFFKSLLSHKAVGMGKLTSRRQPFQFPITVEP